MFALLLEIGKLSDSYELLRKNAECRGQIRKKLCRGDCPYLVNRDVVGVANCYKLLREDSDCGEKWFEVGDDLCMCYLIEQVECNFVSDGGEDLYKIGKSI